VQLIKLSFGKQNSLSSLFNDDLLQIKLRTDWHAALTIMNKGYSSGRLVLIARVCSVVLETVSSMESQQTEAGGETSQWRATRRSPLGNWMIIICRTRHAVLWLRTKLRCYHRDTPPLDTLHNNVTHYAYADYNERRPTAEDVLLVLLFGNVRLSNWW